MQLITPIDFDTSLEEWRDHYRRKSFTLARATMRDVCEYFPKRAGGWYLLGLTELAARDVSNAADHFRHLQELLESGAFERDDFFNKNDKAIRALTPWILRGLDDHTLYAAPYDPWLWLRNWEEVVKTTPTAAGALAFQPLGRMTPLLSDDYGYGDSRPLQRLMDQLSVEPVRVDTMRGLLGRDADIFIEMHGIKIIDESILIEKPMLLAADGTYQPLMTVNVQRPKWGATNPTPPRTISDAPPKVELPPLPKMEPIDTSVPMQLPPVVFEAPNFPRMESLSAKALPGATPVEMAPINIETPPVPALPEMEGFTPSKLSDKRDAPIPAPKVQPAHEPSAAAVREKAAELERVREEARSAKPAPVNEPKPVKPVEPAEQAPPRVFPPGSSRKVEEIAESETATSMEEVEETGRGIASPVIAAATVAGATAAVAATTSRAPAQSTSEPPNPWDIWEREVEDLIDRGAVTEALRRAAEAADKYPQSARLEEFRGHLLERAGRLEESAKSYVAAYKKAKESGATDRARQLLDRVSKLAGRSGPLMLEVGTLLAALGATGVAATLLIGAADYYRRMGERKRLVQILDLLRRVSGSNPEAIDQVRRLEGEVGSLVSEARSLAPQVRPGVDSTTERSSPPRAPIAPRIGSADPRLDSRAARAAKAELEASRNSPTSDDTAVGTGSLLGISFFVLFFTLLTGWTLPSLIGGIFAILTISSDQEKKAPVRKRILGGISLAIFGLAFLYSLVF